MLTPEKFEEQRKEQEKAQEQREEARQKEEFIAEAIEAGNSQKQAEFLYKKFSNTASKQHHHPIRRFR